MRKGFVFLLIFVAIASVVGCNKQINIKSEDKLIIEKLTETEGQYEVIKEITDKEKIENVLKIFKKARWEEASDKSTYPDFKINDSYAIWITSNNKIRVRIDSISKNTFLSEKDSKVLYEIITDEKLGE
ncbi:hypothetical protein [Bacillus massilinigeriensis]|uniref:hypothetical protein n=1 Tax=Bacillus massilionigeriensis TaxID=1805475 RepID=UPI00096B3554|nr:hypothetical protein [Bacillus massilionigeriensis]